MNQKIEDLKRQLSELDDQRKALEDTRYKLGEELNKEITQQILDHQVLSQSVWNFDSEQFVLTTYSRHFPKLVSLLELIQNGGFHHFGIRLWEETRKPGSRFPSKWIELRVDDGDLSIHFANSEDLLFDFVKQYGLKIKSDRAERKIENLEKQLVVLKGIQEKCQKAST